MNRGLLSSDKQDWETPPEIFDPLNEVFFFDMDVCASQDNAKCEEFFSTSGLTSNWHGTFKAAGRIFNPTCWCNPPYSQTEKWLRKAKEEADKGCTVVCLVAARPDTKAWQDVIFPHAKAICFIRGRIKFVGAKDPAMFPSALVVFGPEGITDNQWLTLCKFGAVWNNETEDAG